MSQSRYKHRKISATNCDTLLLSSDQGRIYEGVGGHVHPLNRYILNLRILFLLNKKIINIY